MTESNQTPARHATPLAEMQRVQAIQQRAYVEAVAAVEAKIGAPLPRFRGVTLCVAGYEMPKDLGQAPYYRRFPGLTAKPYWDRSAWSPEVQAALARLEDEFPALREEFEAGVPSVAPAFRGQRTGYFGVADRWLSYALVTETGEPVHEAALAFPRLSRVLGELVGQKLLCKTYFAWMKPGVHLAPHCGGHNVALRMHLALRIPPGDTGLRVGGIDRRWEEGKAIFFDDTFVHEAWNRTDEDRYVLLMRLLHPELSAEERAAYFLIEETYRTSETFLALKAEEERAQAPAPPPRAKPRRSLPLAGPVAPPAVAQAVAQEAAAILAEGRGADGAVDLGAEAGGWADAMIDRATEQAPPARPLACAEGCAACCHEKVLVAPPEVLRLAAALRATRSEADLQAIKDRVAEADRRTRGWTAAQRGAARVPCPLLEGGRCAAYEARPLACRGANAFDARDCERALDRPEGRAGVKQHRAQAQIADAVRNGVAGAAGEKGLDGRLLELNAALRMALEITAVGKPWAKGQRSFAPAVDREAETR